MLEENQLNQLVVQLDQGGHLFPGYRLTYEDSIPTVVGKGGTAIVYLAEDCMDTSRKYAIKVVANEEIFDSRLLTEIQLQNQVATECDNIVRIFGSIEYGLCLDPEGNGLGVQQIEADGNYVLRLQFILMELLEPVIRINRFHNAELTRDELATEDEVLKLAKDIAKALVVAHKQGVMHRDVKLENIFWDAKNECYKLGDFGVATANITNRTMTRLGSEGYVAPEVFCALDRAHYNESADIYSFGMCLYVLLNQLRFPGAKAYRPTGRQYERDFIFPAPINASAEMAQMVRTLCAYEAAKRYDSMASVLCELGRYGRKDAELNIDTIDSDELILAIDEETIHTSSYKSEADEVVDSVLDETIENEKRLRFIEEKNRNKENYRKIVRKYYYVLIPLFALLLHDMTCWLSWGSDFGSVNKYEMIGMYAVIGICVMTLVPQIIGATIAGEAISFQLLQITRWPILDGGELMGFSIITDCILYFMPAVPLLVLILIIQRIFYYRIEYKQGNSMLFIYYRIQQYLLPIISGVLCWAAYHKKYHSWWRHVQGYFFRLLVASVAALAIWSIRNLVICLRTGRKKRLTLS